MVKEKGTRLVASKQNPEIGKRRYNLIKSAMEQYNRAMENGFYIEAIALMESAISDRLESTLNYLCPCYDFSYSTVGKLAETIIDMKKKGKMDYFSNDYILPNDIKRWSGGRNKAVHGMVKLLSENDEGFQKRYDKLKEYAEEGRKLFDRLNAEKRKHCLPIRVFPVMYKLRNAKQSPHSFPETLTIVAKGDVQFIGVDGNREEVYLEADNGHFWRKQLIDLHYDIVKEE